jgi:superfamily II DNA or RNA helicase
VHCRQIATGPLAPRNLLIPQDALQARGKLCNVSGLTAMQILPDHVRPGALVRVRRERWRVVEIRPHDGCQVVTLAGLSPPHVGVERRVLAPFDVLEPVTRGTRLRFVRRTRWRRACRALLANDAPPAALRSARHARIDLLPHQLEPALAVLRGIAARVLLADEVGLGKTIQAGLVLAELRVRRAIDRVLVITPAGVRDQWSQELTSRFGMAPSPVDARVLRQLSATLPIGVNPWSTISIAIASVDYVKRPEVLPAVAACPWDLIVVDEAHGVAGDSDRHGAVRALTSRAAYVLLLTATPHSGDGPSFTSLCDLGSVDGDPLLVFRRTRASVHIGVPRRVHTLHVRLSQNERRMHERLSRYSDAIRAERPAAWLGLAVLHKRALSSAWALAQSVDRRLAVLASSSPGDAGGQLVLPLGDPNGEFTTADEPPVWPAGIGLSDPARERDLLASLAAGARSAALAEGKLSALQRLLRRAGETAVVFTEYRDTLLHVRRRLGASAGPVAVLHGGLTNRERAAVLTDFRGGAVAVLLATDAAGEGLNLHEACRLVINLELPWNPMRLEQRIGRVDRIGQRRTVHAFHLIAAGTGEPAIAARLRARIARAQAEVGAPNPLGDDEERAAARLAMMGEANDDAVDDRSAG